MKHPYVYTMPESFLADQSVPARWRLLAVINSFLLNGKPFYGSNAWLMEQLQCSEQTISNAVAELESLGEIVCERTRRSRLITRKLRDPNQLGSETQTDSSRDPNQLGTISDSISERELPPPSSADFPSEDYEDQPKPKKTDNFRKDYDALVKWLRDLTGAPIVNLAKQYAHLRRARDNKISRNRLMERAEELWGDAWYREHGLDWGGVVSSFDRKA